MTTPTEKLDAKWDKLDGQADNLITAMNALSQQSVGLVDENARLHRENASLRASLEAEQSKRKYLSESLQATRELLAKLELRT